MAKVHLLPLLLLLLTSLLAPSLAFSDPIHACSTEALGNYLLSTVFMFNPSVLDRPATLTGTARRQYRCITRNQPVGTPTVRDVLCRFCRVNYNCNPDYGCIRRR